jgi:hypothetical protein
MGVNSVCYNTTLQTLQSGKSYLWFGCNKPLQGEFQLNPESIFQPKKKRIKIAGSLFLGFLRKDHAEVDTPFAALYLCHKGLCKLILGGLPKGS